MAKQSTSERIRKLLEQGYPVKVISKKLKCSPALVYQVRAYDKKKSKPKQDWVMMEVSTHAEPIGIPREAYEEYFAHKQPKPTLWQRVKSFFGA